MKGRAKAVEYASMPAMGFRVSPPADDTRMLPTKGPVQEKDTSTRVKAMKKTPYQPPLSAWASALFTRLLGSVISNMPRKDMPKSRNTRKNNTLGSQWVLIKLAASFGKQGADEGIHKNTG